MMMISNSIISSDKRFDLELAHLGDLSKFTFLQLSAELAQFHIMIDNFGTYLHEYFILGRYKG